MGLRDIGHTLPPGFRFYPSDEELVCHYLYKKIVNEEVVRGTLVEIDLHTCEPWQLPDVAKLNSKEWYFFSFRDRKYATGFRTNRATTCGYWKATGKDRAVVDPGSGAVVGMRKTLVFYQNRAPNGIKTGWIMHEFRLENPLLPIKEDWVLCRVFHKWRGENSHKFGPQNSYSHPTNDFTFPKLAAPPNVCEQHACQGSKCQDIAFPSHQGQNPSFALALSSGCFPLCDDDDDEGKDSGPHPSAAACHDQANELLVEMTKCEDDRDGFLLDMGLDYCSYGGPTNLDDDVRFDQDRTSVFI